MAQGYDYSITAEKKRPAEPADFDPLDRNTIEVFSESCITTELLSIFQIERSSKARITTAVQFDTVEDTCPILVTLNTWKQVISRTFTVETSQRRNVELLSILERIGAHTIIKREHQRIDDVG